MCRWSQAWRLDDGYPRFARQGAELALVLRAWTIRVEQELAASFMLLRRKTL